MIRFCICALMLMMCASLAQAATGFRQITLESQGNRPLNVAFWYPTAATGVFEDVDENPVFYGEPMLRNATPRPGQHPLVLLSHGYGGSWRNLNWLAHALTVQGYIVAAPNHPGTTTENHDPATARKLWLRPDDISRVLDRLLADEHLAGKVDSLRIAAIGHSLGGWTVMELIGARFSSNRFVQDCQNHAQLADCQLIETLGISNTNTASLLDAQLRNPRIKAAVSLDLGLARGFTPESLARVSVPVLVLSAEQDSVELPSSLVSGYLAQYLPPQQTSFSRIRGATHFSFMQRCKPHGAELIEQSSPGEGFVCRDQGSRTRADIHQELIARITRFLTAALNPPADEMHSASFR